MNFKIGDIITDIVLKDGILFEVEKIYHPQQRILVKVIETPPGYDGFLILHRSYSDTMHNYKIVKRKVISKGHLPLWL